MLALRFVQSHIEGWSPCAGSNVSNSKIAAVEGYLRVDKIAIRFNPEVVLQVDAIYHVNND